MQSSENGKALKALAITARNYQRAREATPEGLKAHICAIAKDPNNPRHTIQKLSAQQEIICKRFVDNFLKGGRLAVKAHRRSGKSMFTTHTGSWLIGLNTSERIALTSATAAIAEKRGGVVRDIIEFDKTYRSIFPKALPDKRKWTIQAWTVKRDMIHIDPTMSCYGIDTSAVGAGGHFFGDDLCDVKDLYSETIRKYRVLQVKSTFVPMVEPGYMIFLIYTPWHQEDANAQMEKTCEVLCFAVAGDYKHIELTTKNSPEKDRLIDIPYWVTPDDFKRAHEDMGDMAWLRCMRMKAVDTTNTIIKPEWIVRESLDDHLREPITLWGAIDPAWGRRLNQAAIKAMASDPCNSAFEVGVRLKDGRLLIIEDIQTTITPEEFFDVIIDTWIKYLDRERFPFITEGSIAFETVFAQGYLFDRLSARCRERSVSLPLVEHKQHVDKNTRIAGLAPHHQHGNIIYEHDITTLVDQALAFPFGNKVDGLDALEMLWYISRQLSTSDWDSLNVKTGNRLISRFDID